MSKTKIILLFDWMWNWRYWYVLPTITLGIRKDEFCIHFCFLGLWTEVLFIKRVKRPKVVYGREEWNTKCDECEMLNHCIGYDVVTECTTMEDTRKHYIPKPGGLCPGFIERSKTCKKLKEELGNDQT